MPRPLQPAVAGTVAGAFSGLFGGGGVVVLVPLLTVWLGWTALGFAEGRA